MDHAEARRIERVINRELGERFPDGAVAARGRSCSTTTTRPSSPTS